LCFVCLNRIAPGVIVHMAHGVVVLGEFHGQPQQRTHDIAAMFQRAGVSCKVSENLEKAHWEKLIWNIPFNGLVVAGVVGLEPLLNPAFPVQKPRSEAHVMTTDKLLGDPRWENLVRELMLEVIAIAGGLGHQIPVAFADKQIERTRSMGAYKAST